ncbi:MAG: glycosyltransferase family 4 protein [Paracoccaceae bacterium]|nr:glycosyltransferase family 4 protein [Paracoccaceae bacterium]
MFFWREVQALEAMGHAVHLLSTRKPPKGLIAHSWSETAMARTRYLGDPDVAAALGALTRLLPRGLLLWMAREGVGFAKDAALVMAAAHKLLSYARAEGLDHVHVHSCGRAALVAALAQRMGGPGYSLTLHGPLSDYGPGQRFKWRRARFATVITTKLRDEVQETLAGHLPERLVIRPMGVDTDTLTRDTPYVPPENGRPVQLFSCGRLNVVKGHQDLMTAMRQLLDQGVDVRLEIAGEDDDGGTGYRQTLEKQMKKLHLRDHVKLLGAIDADAVRAKLQDAHVFVLASWHEPLGVAYMEAMAMGVPAIGTDAGGVRELIEDGVNGVLVEPKNPSHLARAIRDLAADHDTALRLSTAGRAHVEAHFRSSLGAETLVTEIQTALDQSPETGTT